MAYTWLKLKLKVIFQTLLLKDECWIHTDASDFSGSSANFQGYDSFKKSETCVTGTGTTGDCVVTYSEHSGTYSFGGSRVSNVDTVDECKSWCTENSDCGAFDFNNQNECFWHNNGDWENNLNTGASGVTQYRKQPCSTGSTGVTTGGTGK